MFTWICPQCGREVPPAYTECPDCAAKAAGAAGPPPEQPPAHQVYPPPPPQYQQPPYQQGQYPPQPPYPYPQQPYPQQPPYGQPQGQPPQYQPQYPPPPPEYRQPPYQQPVYQQPQYAPPPPASEPKQAPPPAYTAPPSQPETPREAPRGSALFGAPPVPLRRGSGMPTWLLTILCTAGFAALVVGAYWLFGSHRPAAPSTSVESPAAKPGVAASPWQKVIEVSGVRLQEDPKHKGQILVKFVVTNHSDSALEGLSGNVTIWAGTKKSDEDAQGSFAFTTKIGPYESKDVTAPFNTKLKVYELPDWNVMNTDLQITAAAGGGSGQLP
jgi:hypothetical protein